MKKMMIALVAIRQVRSDDRPDGPKNRRTDDGQGHCCQVSKEVILKYLSLLHRIMWERFCSFKIISYLCGV